MEHTKDTRKYGQSLDFEHCEIRPLALVRVKTLINKIPQRCIRALMRYSVI